MNKIVKIFETSAFTFIFLLGCFSLHPAQAQNGSAERIGDFEFRIADQVGWKASADAMQQAENIFKYEGVKLVPSFAYTNSYGSLVFGSVKQLRDGLTFSAEQISSSLPQFPEAWGIKNNDVQNSSGRTDYGLEFAVMRVIGPGDGKVFGRGKLYKTIGVWIDVPVQYQDKNGYHSILISLFYRGFDSKRSSDENLLKSIMNSLNPVTGVSLITEKVYKAQFQSSSGDSALNTKSEPPKVDNQKAEPVIRSKNTEMAGSYLIDVAKSINSVAKRKVVSQSFVSPNGAECENLELISELDLNWLSIMKVVESNYLIYHKCAAMLKGRLTGASIPDPYER